MRFHDNSKRDEISIRHLRLWLRFFLSTPKVRHKSIIHTFLTQKQTHMFTLQPPASCAPLRAFSVGNPKNAKPSRSTAIITRARVSDSPRIIVENDEETKKFRLRDHQREVIRDMGDFASGEVRTRDGDARSRWIFYFSSVFARSFFLRFGRNARADIRPRCP